MRLFMSWLVSLLLLASSARVAQAQVYINELYPAPLDGPEWVELYNSGPDAVNITAWLLEDQLSTPSIIHTFQEVVLPGNTWIKVELATAKLNNTGDGVVLKNATGELIDSIHYTSTQPGKSWSRLPDGATTLLSTDPTPEQSNGTTPSPSPSPSPSPGPSSNPGVSPSPSPAPSPSSNPLVLFLQLSEIMACPETGDTEWLEIYNPTTQAITLNNALVRDGSNTTRVVSTTVTGLNYAVVSWSGSLLNNTGDSLTLLTNSNQTIAQASFGECKTGQSYIKEGGDWTISAHPTKGEPNQPQVIRTETEENNNETSEVKLTETRTIETPIPRLQNEKQSAVTSQYLTSTQSAQLHLDQPLEKPLPPVVDLSQPKVSKWGIINVILGGVFWLSAAGNLLHEHRHLLPQDLA